MIKVTKKLVEKADKPRETVLRILDETMGGAVGVEDLERLRPNVTTEDTLTLRARLRGGYLKFGGGRNEPSAGSALPGWAELEEAISGAAAGSGGESSGSEGSDSEAEERKQRRILGRASPLDATAHTMFGTGRALEAEVNWNLSHHPVLGRPLAADKGAAAGEKSADADADA